MLPYGKQTIEQDDIDAVTQILQSDYLTTGPRIAEFEQALANTTQAKEAVVVGNGTQALHLACIGTELEKGSAAIVPSITFLATANAVRYCGADVLFCDVDPQTGLMDLNHLETLIKNNANTSIKAVLPVHLGGQMVDLETVKSLTADKNITIIADSCHALGSKFKETPAGACQYEDMATFSFHPVKTIAMGEGGAVTLNDTELANHMRTLRSHAMEHTPEKGAWSYEMTELGYNYRATDIQCALGISQIKKLDRFISRRQTLARLYDEQLAALAPAILPPKRAENQTPALHLYAMRIDFEAIGITRDALMKALRKKGIGSQVHYIPVHTQPYYENLYGQQDLPGAQSYYDKTLSLPLYPAMQDEDVSTVVQALKEICGL